MRLTMAIAASLTIHVGLLGLPGREFERSLPTGVRSPLNAILLPTATPQAKQTVPTELVVEANESSTKPRNTAEAAEDAVLPATPQDQRPSSEQDEKEQSAFGIPLPHYYEPNEVSDRAQPRDDIVLDPPALAQFPGAGRIVLALFINEEGRVDMVEVLSTDIETNTLQDSLVNQFRSAQFSPARINGQAVKSKMKIEVIVKPPTLILPKPEHRQSTPAGESSSVPPPPAALPPLPPPTL